MKNFVEKEKMSKKAKKALNAEQRGTWAFNPTTRVVPKKNRNAYDRNRAKRETRAIAW